jgi:hypothetical protein
MVTADVLVGNLLALQAAIQRLASVTVATQRRKIAQIVRPAVL